MSGLDTQIKEAEAAAAAVEQLEQTKQQAAALPALQAQRERLEAGQRARAQFEHAKGEAQSLLAEAAPDLAEWRSRYEQMLLELDELITSLPELQGRIFGAMRVLATASAAISEADAQPGDFSGAHQLQRSQEIPDALRAGPRDLAQIWGELGGMDARLNALDPSEHPASLGAEIAGVVQRRARGTIVFHTSKAGRLLTHFG